MSMLSKKSLSLSRDDIPDIEKEVVKAMLSAIVTGFIGNSARSRSSRS